MVKAICFDFDGVIIDSEKARYDAWQAVFSQKIFLLMFSPQAIPAR